MIQRLSLSSFVGRIQMDRRKNWNSFQRENESKRNSTPSNSEYYNVLCVE
jgi:hypothetical protein